MIAVNERCASRAVAERWRKQYQRGTTWTCNSNNDAQAIYDQLSALNPETATLADIDGIIGNSTWTTTQCVGCGQNVGTYVRFAQDDVEIEVCGDCLEKGAALLRLTSG